MNGDQNQYATVYLTKNGKHAPRQGGRQGGGDGKSGREAVPTELRYGGGGGGMGHQVMSSRALDEKNEGGKHVQVTQSFKIALMKARQAKGWTQKVLAGKIKEKPQVINEYEAGKGIPNPQVIQKLNRALGVKLPKIPKKKKVVD
jgi:putative transcription factor